MSVHTTSQRRFCKFCNVLLPKNVRLEDHDEEFHKDISNARSSSSSPSPSPKAMNTSGRARRKMDTSGRSRKKMDTSGRSRKKMDTSATKTTDAGTTNTSRKSTSTPSTISFSCGTCGKKFATSKGRDRHAASHKRPSRPPRQYLRCYECNMEVETKVYITHLKFHDVDKKDGERTRRGHINVLSSDDNRKYLYLNPNDPRKELPDAILQCPQCPSELFFSTRTYTQHTLKCKKLLGGMQNGHITTEIKTEVESD